MVFWRKNGGETGNTMICDQMEIELIGFITTIDGVKQLNTHLGAPSGGLG